MRKPLKMMLFVLFSGSLSGANSIGTARSSPKPSTDCGCVVRSELVMVTPSKVSYLMLRQPRGEMVAAKACNSMCESDPTTATSHFTAEPTGNSRMTLCRCFRSLQTRQCPTLPGSQSVKVYCRQETPQEEQEGSSEMHYFHQKNAVDLIKEFEDLLANGEPAATEDEHAKLARSIEDKTTSKSVDSDKNNQVFESVLPPPALLPLNVNSEEVTDTECGCIEKYKLEEVDPANSTRLQGGTASHKHCNAFCDGTANVRHFTVEEGDGQSDGAACKCFEHLHTFHCDEEEGAPLVRVHCHHALQKEEDGESHLNYYHQRNTMAAIRTFNKMITKSLLGDDISDNSDISDDSDNEFRFAADHRHVVTEESGPVTAAPADDEIANLGLTALVLGLLALVTIVTLGLKACWDRRRERRKKKAVDVPSISGCTLSSRTSSSGVSTCSSNTASSRGTPPRRERLQSLSAGPYVYERT